MDREMVERSGRDVKGKSAAAATAAVVPLAGCTEKKQTQQILHFLIMDQD